MQNFPTTGSPGSDSPYERPPAEGHAIDRFSDEQRPVCRPGRRAPAGQRDRSAAERRGVAAGRCGMSVELTTEIGAPDGSLIQGYAGWGATDLPLSPEQVALIRVAEHRERREAEAAAEARRERGEVLAWQVAHSGADRSHGEVLQRALRAGNYQDRVEAAGKHVHDCGCDDCDERDNIEQHARSVRAQTPTPPDRWELRKRHAAQDAAMTPEQRRIQALEQELTHVRATSAARGA
jgi:hypothetical protein